jgi:hypothetical protein
MPKHMEELFSRAWNNLLARDSGPLHLRLFLQPLVATILAIRAGWADAWAGRPIYFWTLVREPKKARAVLGNAWQIVGKVFIVAIALDVVYQLIVLQWIYPMESLIVATVLALVPCMVVRAIGNHTITFVRQRRLRHIERVSLDDSRGTTDNSQAADRHDLTHE